VLLRAKLGGFARCKSNGKLAAPLRPVVFIQIHQIKRGGGKEKKREMLLEVSEASVEQKRVLFQAFHSSRFLHLLSASLFNSELLTRSADTFRQWSSEKRRDLISKIKETGS
jgi:hypothetical protein